MILMTSVIASITGTSYMLLTPTATVDRQPSKAPERLNDLPGSHRPERSRAGI